MGRKALYREDFGNGYGVEIRFLDGGLTTLPAWAVDEIIGASFRRTHHHQLTEAVGETIRIRRKYVRVGEEV